MQFFYIVGIFWIASLIFACEKFVVAGAVADWYFNRLAISNVFISVSCRLCLHAELFQGIYYYY